MTIPGPCWWDEAGIDIDPGGDSVAMTVLGHANTVLGHDDEMCTTAKAVARGAQRAFLVARCRFLSYQVEPAEAVRNAGRFLKEAGMDAVKLEGGQEVLDSVRAIVRAGIPVMGHLGLTPQTATKLGGYKVQGSTAAGARQLLDDALALQEACCFSLVLEAVPAPVGRLVSQRLAIPTVALAAAPAAMAVLVFHDVLGRSIV